MRFVKHEGPQLCSSGPAEWQSDIVKASDLHRSDCEEEVLDWHSCLARNRQQKLIIQHEKRACNEKWIRDTILLT